MAKSLATFVILNYRCYESYLCCFHYGNSIDLELGYHRPPHYIKSPTMHCTRRPRRETVVSTRLSLIVASFSFLTIQINHSCRCCCYRCSPTTTIILNTIIRFTKQILSLALFSPLFRDKWPMFGTTVDGTCRFIAATAPSTNTMPRHYLAEPRNNNTQCPATTTDKPISDYYHDDFNDDPEGIELTLEGMQCALM